MCATTKNLFPVFSFFYGSVFYMLEDQCICSVLYLSGEKHNKKASAKSVPELLYPTRPGHWYTTTCNCCNAKCNILSSSQPRYFFSHPCKTSRPELRGPADHPAVGSFQFPPWQCSSFGHLRRWTGQQKKGWDQSLVHNLEPGIILT